MCVCVLLVCPNNSKTLCGNVLLGSGFLRHIIIKIRYRCVDFVQVTPEGTEDFGASESCGTIPGEDEERVSDTGIKEHIENFKLSCTCIHQFQLFNHNTLLVHTIYGQ